MKLLRTIVLGFAIAFAILGCGILLRCIGLSLTLGSFEYGDITYYSSLGKNPDSGKVEFTEYSTGEAPWYTFISAWWWGFACLCVSAICFAHRLIVPTLKRLKPLFKRLAIGCGILLIVFALFLLEENVRGKIALHAYLRQLRPQGEKLTLAEIDLPKPPKEGNGASALVALTNQFNSLRKNCPFNVNALTRMRLVAQGRGVVRSEQGNLGVNRTSISSELRSGPAPRRWNRGREPEDTNFPAPIQASWADLEDQAAQASNTLRAVKMALAQPTLNVEIDYARSYAIGLRHLQATRDATSWVALTALNDIHRRNLAAATENVLTIAALMRFQPDERFVDSQFTLWQTGLVGLDMTWEALQAPGWTDEQLATLQQTWQKDGVIQNTRSALEMECVSRLNSFEQCRLPPLWSELGKSLLACVQHGGLYSSLRDRFSEVRNTVHAIVWRLAWADQDKLRALQRYQLLLDCVRSAIVQRDWSAYGLLEKDFPPAHSYYDRCRYLLSDTFRPDVERGNGSLRAFEFETQREMTVAAIAIKHCQLLTGKLPSNLAELVPEYLQQLPHDWMNGKPLGYHSNPDGTFKLYSVGFDGRDDGGDPTPIRGTRTYSIWDERDAVWPMPASAAEIDAARSRR